LRERKLREEERREGSKIGGIEVARRKKIGSREHEGEGLYGSEEGDGDRKNREERKSR